MRYLIIISLLSFCCESHAAYLFTYFTGNKGVQESIRFALSHDGYVYHALKSNAPVIASDTISAMGGVRDPHILRGTDDGMFYMVVTDMKSEKGWNSNHGMVLLKSSNLIDWTHSQIDMHIAFPQFNTVNRVWAPQTIYDKEVGKYMVYWSMRSGNDPDVIYYSYANSDFTALETVPQVLFLPDDRGACIDGDIIEKDERFHLFFKTEGNGNGIKKAVSSRLTGGYVVENNRFLQATSDAVEGSCIFRLADSDKYILMYDVYNAGKYEFMESVDLETFSVSTEEIKMNFTPRHGTVIPVTEEEARRLADRWALGAVDLSISGYQAKEIKNANIVTNRTEVFLPVENGTDLKHFDPGILSALPGVTISPVGPQDFHSGSVDYKLSAKSMSRAMTYTIHAAVNNNPVLRGYYAEPDILYSKKNNSFYLYPACDGYPGRAGQQFKVFESKDLVAWSEKGTLLDLSTSDVSWAESKAWAPCIEEKEENGTWKYYYYFTAGQQIGVALADEPTGPFTDSGKPIIPAGMKPSGVVGGQEIYPDVFTDPVDGKSYLYWGSTYLAGAELTPSMISIKESSMQEMTPCDGTFQDGISVFFRNGKYYFLWSENNSDNADYCVRYGIGSQALGPIRIPDANRILKRNDAEAIYGTGHCSVLQLPGKDEWYIVYQRFTRPAGITMGSAAGYHREVCIDHLTFDEEGNIKEVIPTLEGITPLTDSPSRLVSPDWQDTFGFSFSNPVRDCLHYCIEATNLGQDQFTFWLRDVSGRLLLTESVEGTEGLVDCRHLTPGCYLLTVKKTNTDRTFRLIKI